ncbi:hypothetical protein BSKO_13693 [Bryopsis sp. KO-2023]|nr:hypothetical protein BSKO_13693 [Bryopsis sp. KO-2023]
MISRKSNEDFAHVLQNCDFCQWTHWSTGFFFCKWCRFCMMRIISTGWRSPALTAGVGSLLRKHIAPKKSVDRFDRHAFERGHKQFQLKSSTCSKCSAASSTVESPSTSGSVGETEKPELVLFNTMGRSKSPFVPMQKGRVSLYVCGVTVYDFSHVGHARAYVAFDILYRLLLELGYDVTYVRNFTDIDDKIIKRANETEVSCESLSQKFIDEFHVDMDALGCKSPSHEPKATEFVPQIISMIEKIVENGHAYVLGDGDVFFDTESLEGYGRLSGRKQDDNRAGERVAVDGRKRNMADFALWKSAKPDEPFWESPWGKGRPGWHIECSCMIKEIFGPVIDIHGGGCDLVFPHHENELAQSQAAAGPCEKDVMLNGKDFVGRWMHNGFVNINDEKMSKSLGNFFTIRDVLKEHHPLAMRWMLLGTQYRQPLSYSQPSLEEAGQNVFYVYQTLADIDGALTQAGEEASKVKYERGTLMDDVLKALCDDLNSSVATAAVYGALKPLNDLIHTKKGKKKPNRLQMLVSGVTDIRSCLDLLGFGSTDPGRVIKEMKDRALTRADMTEEEVQAIIDLRNEARKAKDYSKADEYRNKLLDVGILMCDTPQGTTWRPGTP